MRKGAALLAVLGSLALPTTAGAAVLHEWQQNEPDCPFAAAAAWESVELGVVPSNGEVFSAWWASGGRGKGTTIPELSRYWSHNAIDGVRATVGPVFRPPPRSREAFIAVVEPGLLAPSAQWPTRYGAFPTTAVHDVLLLGWTSRGARVVSWGAEWTLTYSEWDSMHPEYYAVRVLHARREQ